MLLLLDSLLQEGGMIMKDRKEGWAISELSMLGFLGITVGLINLAVDIFGYLQRKIEYTPLPAHQPANFHRRRHLLHLHCLWYHCHCLVSEQANDTPCFPHHFCHRCHRPGGKLCHPLLLPHQFALRAQGGLSGSSASHRPDHPWMSCLAGLCFLDLPSAQQSWLQLLLQEGS